MASTPSLDDLFAMAESIRGANLRARTVDSIREQLLALLSGYELNGIGRSSHQVWYRARRCEGGTEFSSLSDMIYPPSGSPDFGRAQLPGSSVLYASWNPFTALDEIGAQAGDMIQIIALRPIAGVDVPCHVVGEYQNFNNSGRSLLRSEKIEQYMSHLQSTDIKRFISSVFVDSVVAELFRYPVKRAFEYKFTAVYSELLLRAKGGLIYPSVETSGGMNLAVSAATFDSEFEVLSTEVLKIERSYGYGLYVCSLLRQSCDFETNGCINWGSMQHREFIRTPQAGLQEAQHIPGWRKGA